METPEIITKDSPRWDEFITRLDTLLAEWDCTTDQEQTNRALEAMGNVDIDGTPEYLRSKGGYCDCEVMMNVAFGGDQ